MDPKIFFKLSYGLYVISSTSGDKLNAQVANSVIQVSAEPATVAISINKKNLTHEYIEASKVFAVSILPKSVPLNVIGHFGFKSGREMDKFAELSFKKGQTGAPLILENSLGYLEAEVISSMDAGTHTIFLGKVVNSEVFSEEDPMTYAYYHQVKRGAPAAPAAAKEETPAPKKEESKGDPKMKRYECTACGYIYDPAIGDPDSGIAAGTAFTDLPEDWVCPVCGVSKEMFEEVA